MSGWSLYPEYQVIHNQTEYRHMNAEAKKEWWFHVQSSFPLDSILWDQMGKAIRLYLYLLSFANRESGILLRKYETIAKHLRRSPRQLENLAMERKGPPYYRRGKFAIYSVSDFVEWITRHPVKTTNTEE